MTASPVRRRRKLIEIHATHTAAEPAALLGATKHTVRRDCVALCIKCRPADTTGRPKQVREDCGDTKRFAQRLLAAFASYRGDSD